MAYLVGIFVYAAMIWCYFKDKRQKDEIRRLAKVNVFNPELFSFQDNCSCKKKLKIRVGYLTAMHSIGFGHSRYHLPLIPWLTIFASWALIHFKDIWGKRNLLSFRVSIMVLVIFVIIWMRVIIFGDGARYFHNVGVSCLY